MTGDNGGQAQQKVWSELYNDLSAELTLAWLCLHEPAAVEAAAGWLQASEFWDPITAAIWSAFQSARQAGRPFDLERVIIELAAADANADPAAIRESVEQTVALAAGTAREATWSAWRVRAAAIARQLFAVLETATAKLLAGEAEAARSVMIELPEQADRLVGAEKLVDEALDRLNSGDARQQ